MKFDFKILNHDAGNEVLYVRYTAADPEFGIVKLRLSLSPDAQGKWPTREETLLMIRRNAPIQQWQREARARSQPNEDLRSIVELIGYEEKGVTRPLVHTIGDPKQFPKMGVI